MTDVFLDQIVAVLLMIVALIWIKYPPKKINSLYGYRSTRSMKNDENWEYSNKLAARYMLVVSLLSLVVGIPLSIYSKSETAGMINMFIAVIGMVVIIPVIENKLKKFEQETN